MRIEGRAGHPFFAELQEFAQTPVREFEPVRIEKWMSKWMAVSGLHKSIRRGRVEKALQMADLLLRMDPAHFWRRLPVIALEDVGHADPWLIARIGWASGQNLAKDELGDRELALRFVDRMASGTKDRTSCDLTCLAQAHRKMSLQVLNLGFEDAIRLLKDPEHDLLFRAKVAISLVAGDLGKDLPSRFGRITLRQLAELYAEMGADPETCSAIRWAGSRRSCKEMAAVFGLMGRMAENAQTAEKDSFFAEEADIGPFPSAAFDQYTREGLRAYAYFLKACPPVARWMDDAGIDQRYRVRMIGRLVFRAEGDHLNPRLRISRAYEIRDAYIAAVAANYAVDSEHFLRGIELVRLNIPLLRHARARILGLAEPGTCPEIVECDKEPEAGSPVRRRS